MRVYVCPWKKREAVIRKLAFAVVNCSQLVTMAGPNRPRVGPELRELAIIPGAAHDAVDKPLFWKIVRDFLARHGG